ncbi:hypothetical protein RUM44_007833 [Polyplax serrata]|uniref:G-protein coupled receptors family 1 profile domain-containing protein n=1 Tax=Polyplax serrata TaxID=468196 RepID=A0ABR1B7B1_POLSC
MSNDTWLEGNLTTLDDNPWSNLNVPYTVAEFLVAIAAIIGNLLVIVVYLKERRLRKRTKYYIISLAIADLLRLFKLGRDNTVTIGYSRMIVKVQRKKKSWE